MAWELIARDFEWDGGLRDIYVLETTEVEWDKLLDALRSWEPPPVFQVDGVIHALPVHVAEVFSVRATHSPLLTILVGGAVLNCHFFGTDEIEFDLDPKEIGGPDQAERSPVLCDYLGK